MNIRWATEASMDLELLLLLHFFWYDLEKEASTSLLLHPFCFMDANAYYEKKMSSRQALDELQRFYKEVKNINGTMITIWHNNILGTSPEFTRWREAYEKFIQIISDKH